VFNRAVLLLAAAAMLLLLLLLVLASCACRYFPAQQLSRPELGCEVVDGATFRLVPQPGGQPHPHRSLLQQQQQQQWQPLVCDVIEVARWHELWSCTWCAAACWLRAAAVPCSADTCAWLTTNRVLLLAVSCFIPLQWLKLLWLMLVG
jgi:hypothetical protein